MFTATDGDHDLPIFPCLAKEVNVVGHAIARSIDVRLNKGKTPSATNGTSTKS